MYVYAELGTLGPLVSHTLAHLQRSSTLLPPRTSSPSPKCLQFDPDGFQKKLDSRLPCYNPEKVRTWSHVAAKRARQLELEGCAATAGWPRAHGQAGGQSSTQGTHAVLPPVRVLLPPTVHLQREEFLPHTPPLAQDLVMPLMKRPDHYRLSPMIGGPTRERRWLAFHRGRVRRSGGGLKWSQADNH